MAEIKLKNLENFWESIPELEGNAGNTGTIPSITFNTLSGSKANVTQSGTPENLQVNLTVPNGVPGTIPNESSLVKKSGNTGSLGGYNTPFITANALTINEDSNDNNQVTGAVTITVSNGSSNTEWIKSVMITNPSASVSLGSEWIWSGGTAPTIVENSLLVLHWCNDVGVANLIDGAAYLRTYTGTVYSYNTVYVYRDNTLLYTFTGGSTSPAMYSCDLAVGDQFSAFLKNDQEASPEIYAQIQEANSSGITTTRSDVGIQGFKLSSISSNFKITVFCSALEG